jgi:hypothetical protein
MSVVKNWGAIWRIMVLKHSTGRIQSRGGRTWAEGRGRGVSCIGRDRTSRFVSPDFLF